MLSTPGQLKHFAHQTLSNLLGSLWSRHHGPLRQVGEGLEHGAAFFSWQRELFLEQIRQFVLLLLQKRGSPVSVHS
jgi:hypothetical protein